MMKISPLTIEINIRKIREVIEALQSDKKIKYYTENEEFYMYGHHSISHKKVYYIDTDTKKMLLEFLYDRIDDMNFVVSFNTNKFLKKMIRLGVFGELEPIRTYDDYGGESKQWWEKKYELYEAEAPLLIEHTYTPYSHKYSTYLRPRTNYYLVNESNIKYETIFDQIDKQVDEVSKYCEDEDIRNEIRKLLEKGYRVEYTDEVTVNVGSTSTSVSDWSASYKLICGEIKEEIKECETDWGWCQYVTLKPKDVAIVKYRSWGTLAHWKQKTVYVLSPKFSSNS